MNKSLQHRILPCSTLMIIMLLRFCIYATAQDTNDQRITLLAGSVSLASVLKHIEKQTNKRFNYSESELNTDEKVSVNYNEAPLNQVLGQLFSGRGFSWRMIDNGIYLRKDPEPAMTKPLKDSGNLAPVMVVTGSVADEKGQPLIGATIKVINSGRGTLTDEKGRFRITDVPVNATIMVSFTGFTEQRVLIRNRTDFSVFLKPAVSLLDGTVIIGYGTTTQRYNTGSINKVTGKEIEQQPVANPLTALQGRMPGVFITNTNGLPGANVKIQIRGINSIVTNSDAGGGSPLFIVDGVPFTNVPLNSTNGFMAGANGNLSPLNSINPNDIESVEVLKDADATSIYGSRAANGVILITTKKGKAGKTILDINLYTGMEKATNLVKSLNTPQYLEMRKAAFANDSITPTISNAPDLLLFDPNQYTDIQKLILGNSSNVTNAQVNVSGGNNSTRFILGGSFWNEGTIYPGDLNYHRGGIHMNIEHNSPDNKLFVSLTGNYTSDKNNSLSQPIAGLQLAPNYPVYDSSGKLNWVGGDNPLAYTKQSSTSKTNALIGNGIFRYSILPDLNAQISLGYTNTNFNTILTTPLSSLNPNAFNPISKATYGNNGVTTYIVEPQLNYTRQIAQGRLQALLGGTWQYTNTSGSLIQGQSYSNDGLLKDQASAAKLVNPSSNYTEYKYVSLFARMNYNWQNKYILNAVFRRDGSSRFGPDKRFGNFGSGGLAWLFSNEDFVKEIFPFLSYGKLRASYGLVGNDQITDYAYLSTYRTSGVYQSLTGLIPSRIANPDYSWEVTRKLEVAMELGFINDRVLLTANWFKNKSNNQLVGYPLPTQTGFSSYQANLPATIQNTGTELLVNTVNIKSAHFNWKSSFNLSFIDNKLLSFPGLAGTSYANKYIEGKSVSIVKGYHFTGIDPNTGLPQFATADSSKKNAPSMATDFAVMGKTLPEYYGGISNTFTWKGLELNFLFQFVKQEGNSPSFWPGSGRLLPPEALNRWQKKGDITDVPVASTVSIYNAAGTASVAFTNSDRFWTDASYIRLKNLMLSYSLPLKLIQQIKLNQCRIYLQGQNLWTITNYKGSDPEIPSARYIVPTLRVICAGLQITL